MKQFLFSADNSLAGLLMRLTLGLLMFPHGAQKMFGLFGGYGFNATMKFFTETLKLPWAISVLVILVECIGALCLVLGFGSKIWALLFIFIMGGAIITTHYTNGFFMNWFGNQQGEGIEYHLLIIGLCLALFVTGSGKLSLDRLITAA